MRIAFRFLRLVLASVSIGAVVSFLFLGFLSVPDGSSAIVINQLDRKDIRSLGPGTHYLADGFIPEKYQIILISGDENLISINFKTDLKYTRFLNLPDYFTFKASVGLAYRINQKNILRLFYMNNQKITNINKFVESRFLRLLEKKFYEIYQAEEDIPELRKNFSVYLSASNPDFRKDWQDFFYYKGEALIELEEVYIHSVHLPDYYVYRQMTANLPEIVRAKRVAFLARIDDEARIETQKESALADYENAERFLKLINQNPMVLQFFQIQKLNPKATEIIIGQNGTPVISGSHKTDNLPQSEDETLTLPPIRKN